MTEKENNATKTITDSEDIDKVLSIFGADADTSTGNNSHEVMEYVDNPDQWLRQQVGRAIKPNTVPRKPNANPRANIKKMKRVASAIVFWICILAAICTTACITLGAWMLFEPELLLFTIIMVIIAMVITLVYTLMYMCIKEAINTSC